LRHCQNQDQDHQQIVNTARHVRGGIIRSFQGKGFAFIGPISWAGRADPLILWFSDGTVRYLNHQWKARTMKNLI